MRSGSGSSRTVTARDDAEVALAAGEEREQVVAGRVERAAARLDHVAVGVDRAHREQVVRGEAVLEAVHAARVLGHVAADRADRAGSRDRARRRARAAPRPRRPARLRTPGSTVAVRAERVELDHAAHLRHHQQHAVAARDRAAGDAGARAARHHRHAARAARLHHRAHLLLGLGQHRHHRRLAMRDEGVGLEGPQALLVGDHVSGGRMARSAASIRDRVPACERAIRTAAGRDAAPCPPFTRIAPYSAQRCSVGTILPGLSSPCGIERRLDRVELRELRGARTGVHIWLIFSMPTPCSPVMVPPTSMHSSRSSAANALGASRARPGRWRRRGSADAGCRRPRGTRWRSAGRTARDSSSVRRSTCASAPRGIEPSMQ